MSDGSDGGGDASSAPGSLERAQSVTFALRQHTPTWSRVDLSAPLPPLACHSAGTWHQRLVLLCGCESDLVVDPGVYCVDILERSWTQVSPSGDPLPRVCSGTGCQVGRYLFHAGGRIPSQSFPHECVDTMFRIDLETFEVKHLAPTPVALHSGSMTLHEASNRLFLTAASQRHALSTDTFVYDIATNTWSVCATTGTITHRAGACGIMRGDRLYVFGGNYRLSPLSQWMFLQDVIALDIRTMHWEAVEVQGNLPPPIAAMTGCKFNDLIVLFGGWNQIPARQYFSDLYTFNPETNEFSVLNYSGPKPPQRSAHSFVPLHNSFLICGGWAFYQSRVVLNDLYELKMPINITERTLPRDMGFLQRTGFGTDANLRVGSESFPVHRCIMYARCPYFRALLTSGMRDSSSSDIWVSDTTPQIMQEAIHYMYTDEFRPERVDLASMLLLASRLGLDHLQQLTEAHLVNHLDDDNVVPVYQFAWDNHCEVLLSAATHFIAVRFNAHDPRLEVLTPRQAQALQLGVPHAGKPPGES